MNSDLIIRAICNAVLESAHAGGEMGAPGGVLYAAMMTYGVTLDQYERIMGGLVRARFLEKRGQCYHITEGGRKAIGK